MEQRPLYEAALLNGTVDHEISRIQRRYFNRFPISKGDDYEPTAEELAAVDDDNPVPDPMAPVASDFDVKEDYDAAMKAWADRQDLVKFKKDQIRRRLKYQYRIDHQTAPVVKANNPFSKVIDKLAEKKLKKPRLQSAMQVWRRDQQIRAVIEKAAQARARAEGVDLRRRLAPIREDVARSLFADLGEVAQRRYSVLAKEEHDAAMLVWKRELDCPVSTDPEDRQRCIKNLASVVEPILDMICEATGWKASLITGGPVPSEDGRLSVLSIHSGTTNGDVAMNFGRIESVRYYKHLVPMYSSFLRKCYPVPECQSRALAPNVDEDDERDDMGDLEDDSRQNVMFDLLHMPNIVPPQPGASLTPIPSPSVSRVASPAVSRVSSPAPPASPIVSAPSPASVTATRPIPRLPPAPPSPNPFLDSAAPVPPAPIIPQPQPLSEVPQDVPVIASQHVPVPAVTPPPVVAAVTPPPVVPVIAPIDNENPDAGTSLPVHKRTGIPMESGVSKKAKGNAGRKLDRAKDQWYRDCMVMFTDGAVGLGEDRAQSLGTEWVALIQAWSTFQVKAGFDLDSKLTTKNRPAIIKEWIGRARSSSYRPGIVNLKRFCADFEAWWTNMQPAWRLVGGKIVGVRVEGDWSVLARPGINGLVSVVAALFYWGLEVHSTGVPRKVWVSVVEDVTLVLRQVLRLV